MSKRIFILTAGSQGDVQPYVALGIPGFLAMALPIYSPTRQGQPEPTVLGQASF